MTTYLVQCPLWLPLDLSRRLCVTRDGQPVPVPMFTWFCWLYANAEAIRRSATCTDSLPAPEVA